MRKNWILTGVAALILSMALTGCPIEEENKTEPLPPIEQVWMYGSFTSWFAGDPLELTKRTDGTFFWTGTLEASSYLKFVGNEKTHNDQQGIFFAPAGNADVQLYCQKDVSKTESFSIFRNTGHKDKKSWQIMSAGTYEITVNVDNKRVEFLLKEGDVVQPILPDPVNFDAWLVGASTASGSYSGWEMPTSGIDKNLNKMVRQSSGAFTWTGILRASSEGVSFVTNKVATPAWQVDGWFTAPGAGTTPVSVNGVINVKEELGVQQNSGQHPMFKIETAGKYTVTLNTNTMKVTFIKTEDMPYEKKDAIWLVGPSTAADDGYDGWKMPSAGNPNIMTTTDKITYTWTGNLKQSPNYGTGEDPGVAFITDFDGKDPNWGDSVWFVANNNIDSGECQAVVSGVEYGLVKLTEDGRGNNNYNMFNITGAGNYTITLNVNTLKVKFVKN